VDGASRVCRVEVEVEVEVVVFSRRRKEEEREEREVEVWEWRRETTIEGVCDGMVGKVGRQKN
jgi:hypothetical protein